MRAHNLTVTTGNVTNSDTIDRLTAQVADHPNVLTFTDPAPLTEAEFEPGLWRVRLRYPDGTDIAVPATDATWAEIAADPNPDSQIRQLLALRHRGYAPGGYWVNLEDVTHVNYTGDTVELVRPGDIPGQEFVIEAVTSSQWAAIINGDHPLDVLAGNPAQWAPRSGTCRNPLNPTIRFAHAAHGSPTQRSQFLLADGRIVAGDMTRSSFREALAAGVDDYLTSGVLNEAPWEPVECDCGTTITDPGNHHCTMLRATGDMPGVAQSELRDGILTVVRPDGNIYRFPGDEADFTELAVDTISTWTRWTAQNRTGTPIPPDAGSSVTPPATRSFAYGNFGGHNYEIAHPAYTTIQAHFTDHPEEPITVPVQATLPSSPDDLTEMPSPRYVSGTATIRADRYGQVRVDPNEVAFTQPNPTAATTIAAALTEAINTSGAYDLSPLLETASRYRARIDLARRRCLTNQQTAASRFQPESSYAENLDRFKAVYTRTRNRTPGEQLVPYTRHDATDGTLTPETGRGFGVEIEYEFPHLTDDYDDPPEDWEAKAAARDELNAAIAQDLHDLGLIPDPSQTDYHSERADGMWAFEADETVHGEVISPVLYDTPEAWDNLEHVCAVLRRHGAEVTANCGGHVHVGVGDYDHDPDIHKRLIEEVAANEDFLFRVGANPDVRQHRGINWCQPIWADVTGYTRVDEISAVAGGHSTAVNFTEVNGETHDHVEYRFFDGSLDPAIIQTHVRLAGAMTQAALAGRTTGTTGLPPQRLGDARRMNPGGRHLTGEEWDARIRRPAAFLDNLFQRDSDKDTVIALFAHNRWAR